MKRDYKTLEISPCEVSVLQYGKPMLPRLIFRFLLRIRTEGLKWKDWHIGVSLCYFL